MSTDNGGKPLTLPEITSFNNLSNKNLQSHSSSGMLKPRDRAYSMDSSAGDSDGAHSSSAHGGRSGSVEMGLSSRQLQHLFPYHISVDRDFNVVQLGEKLYPLVRCTLSPTGSKKRLNQHASKYFRIVAPAAYVNCWDAKMLSSMHLHSSGLLEVELVGRESLVSSTSQRQAEDSLQGIAARLLLRGRFHEVTGYFPPSASAVIYEHEQDAEGQEGSDGSGKRFEEPSGCMYLFLMHPSNLPGEGESAYEDGTAGGHFAHIATAAAPTHAIARSASADSSDVVSKLLAENAALLAENARLKEENTGKDMRGMIGNVAHDLKTPLAAFMGGVDLINDMAQECVTVLTVEQQQLLQLQAELDKISPRTKGNVDQRIKLVNGLKTILKNISQQAGGVRDINQFMTMTINRCIDYTKASQGIKLVPRNETINLTEVLAMPINCMIASQTKVAFRLHPPPLDICSHIITDKIWLQENILCLLSNAAKYSNAGRVDIQISLLPAQSLAQAAVTATAQLNTLAGATGSHKAERTPTENLLGPLSAKQVCTIHNQRTERAAALALASAAAVQAGGGSGKGGGRESKRNAARSGSLKGAASHRNSATAIVSNASAGSKVLSPVVPPYRQTISGSTEASAAMETAARVSLGLNPGIQIQIPSQKISGTSGASSEVTPVASYNRGKEELIKTHMHNPRGSSGKMESRPRASTTTDPLTNASSSYEDYPYQYQSSSTSNVASPKSPLSPINHHGGHANSSPTHHSTVANAAVAASSYPPPASGGGIGGAIGGALGLVRGSTGKFGVASASPGHSHPQSRTHSQSNSRSQSHNHSRSHSADVPENSVPTAGVSVSSPIAFIRARMGKADKLRHSVHKSFDQNDDEAHSQATSTMQEDIEAMALRGSFSSDGEGGGDEDRQSLYSDASSRQVSTDSRQYSTDSRQYSSDSRGFRFSMDLTMGNLEESADDEDCSARTVLSQYQLLYPPTSAVAPLSCSPSASSYLAANSHIISTPVEVFPQHGGGLFTNRPLQAMQHTNQGSGRGATPTNLAAAAPAAGDNSNTSAAHAPPPAPPSPQASALLLIEISDTGIGLTESNMNKLYSPFMQAQRLAGGTGLGLYSLSKRLDALGGHYGVECRKDGQPGSLFWFAIPYRQDEDASANFSRLQRSGSSRLQDLILSVQPSLAELMASDATGADAADNGGSAKSVADPEPQAESAPHSLHCSTQSSLSLVTNTNSTRTSQGSIPPLSPSNASTFGIAQGNNNSPGHLPIASSAPPGILPSSGPMHFLLVDDSESILKVTSMLLVRSGHTVERAENGVIALEKLATSTLPGGRLFDVVVMDLQMPVLDGLEATKRLRELEEERAIAVEAAAISAAMEEGKDGQEAADAATARLRRQIVIGLSANGDDETMQEAYSAGVDRFIEKPFTIQKLLDALAEIRAEAAAP